MSNFICEQCGKEIMEGSGGHYITGCEHYPMFEQESKEDRNCDKDWFDETC